MFGRLGRTWTVALVVITAFAILVALLLLKPQGKGPVPLAAENCDASLWSHVYQPKRLVSLVACTAVEGRVVSVQREGDGDVHIELDPADRSVLNIINRLHTHGHLVVEVICQGDTPSGGDAVAACAGFTPQVAIPKAGDHVRVTGAYVTDRDNGWNEIHPVTRIEILQ
jgi:hypothetical protein